MRDIYEAMTLLANRGLKHMTLDELKMLSGATDIAESEARRLAAVCDGIACLVNTDATAKLPGGNFQSESDVFDLLCSLSHSLSGIAGLIYLGGEAELKVQERLEALSSR